MQAAQHSVGAVGVVGVGHPLDEVAVVDPDLARPVLGIDEEDARRPDDDVVEIPRGDARQQQAIVQGLPLGSGEDGEGGSHPALTLGPSEP